MMVAQMRTHTPMPRKKKLEARHTGHKGVYQLTDGRYQIRFTAVSPKTGKVVYRKAVLPEGTTLGQAIDELVQRQEELRQGQSDVSLQATRTRRRVTLRDYAAEWLQRRSLAEGYTWRTHNAHAAALAHHILPLLGDYYMDSLTRADVEAWVGWAGTRRKQIQRQRQFKSEKDREQAQMQMPLCSLETRKGWWRVLRVLLKDAHADGLLEADITYRISGPKKRKEDVPRREVRTLDSLELTRLLQVFAEHYTERYAEIVVLGVTGMRSGELWALHWSDLELDAKAGGRITVRASVQNHKDCGDTKTKAPREIPIPGWVCQVLLEHRRAMVQRQAPGLDKGIVFPSLTGGHRTRGSLRGAFLGAVKRAQIQQRVTPQVLRRTFNTLMLEAGVDRIVLRSMMGHCSEEMTERYAGVGLEAKAQAQATLITPLVGGKP